MICRICEKPFEGESSETCTTCNYLTSYSKGYAIQAVMMFFGILLLLIGLSPANKLFGIPLGYEGAILLIGAGSISIAVSLIAWKVSRNRFRVKMTESGISSQNTNELLRVFVTIGLLYLPLTFFSFIFLAFSSVTGYFLVFLGDGAGVIFFTICLVPCVFILAFIRGSLKIEWHKVERIVERPQFIVSEHYIVTS
ncbi:MAG: hypothetical protein P1Q69_18810 [Candidatus Thorarchaeota archaeon]|nr:hypothetical protein [Candidatus Thorarchaeota archaeon]